MEFAEIEKAMEAAGDRTISIDPSGRIWIEPEARDDEIRRLTRLLDESKEAQAVLGDRLTETQRENAALRDSAARHRGVIGEMLLNLGGTVDGEPPTRENFLRRIEELRQNQDALTAFGEFTDGRKPEAKS